MNRTILFLLFIIFSVHVYGNQTPIISGSFSTGEIIPKTEHDVAIEKERLKIVFTPLKTYVRVTYICKNYGNTKSIKVAFPHNYFSYSMDDRQKSTSLKKIVVKINGKKIPYTTVKRINSLFTRKGKKKKGYLKIIDMGIEESFTEYIIYTLNMKKSETFKLSVSYDVNNSKIGESSWGFRENSYFFPDQFQYILTTAKRWRGGAIKDFKATVVLKNCSLDEIRLSPGKFRPSRRKGSYIWKARNFRPYNNIRIQYFPRNMTLTKTDSRFYPDTTYNNIIPPMNKYRFYPFVKSLWNITKISWNGPLNNPMKLYFEITKGNGKSFLKRITLTKKKKSISFAENPFRSTLFGIHKGKTKHHMNNLKVEVKYGIPPNGYVDDIVIGNTIGTYIICDSAHKTKKGAIKRSNQLKNKGHKADFLWIPDYPSLSKAKMFEVYTGPYFTLEKARKYLRQFKAQERSGAYILQVSNSYKRKEFR